MQRIFILGLLVIGVGCNSSTTEPVADFEAVEQSLTWKVVGSTNAENTPGGRDFYAAATVGGRIYAIEYEGIVHRFEPADASWSETTRLPDFRMEAGLAVAEGRLYVLGGQLGEGVGTARVDSYDPLSDTWMRHADLPLAVCKPGVARIGGTIFVIGGDGPGGPQKLVQRYDIASGSWMLGTEMPTRRCALALGVNQGKILAIGGIGGGYGNWWHIVRTVEEYDPVADSWTLKAPLPDARDRLTAVSMTDHVFVLGGRTLDEDDPASAAVLGYDPVQGVWSEKSPMEHDRYYHATAVLGNDIYVMGGRTDGGDVETTVERGRFR